MPWWSSVDPYVCNEPTLSSTQPSYWPPPGGGSWQWAEERVICKQVDVVGDRPHPLAGIWRTQYCQTHRLSLIV